MIDRYFMNAAATGIAVVLACGLVMPGQAGAQTKAGWVTVVLEEEPEGLDGCNANRSTPGRVIRQNVVETLTEINPEDGKITPRLATSWEQVNESTWRFKLREGVKFHDGAPFNAAAVVAGMSRTLDTTLECETRTKSFGTLKLKGVAVDEYTLDVIASPPDPIVPTRMGVVSLVSPNTPTDRLVLTPIGTGAYKFDNWLPGQEITVVRNPDWWGEATNIEGARYVFRSESSVRAAMVQVNEADFAATISEQDATNPATDFSYPNAEVTKLRIEMGRKPLDDIRVRMALNLAFDRYAIPGTVLSKDVQQAVQIVGPSVSGHNFEIGKKLRPYDPEKAAQLVAEAKADGVPVDQEIWIVGRTNHYPGIVELLEAMSQMFNVAGLNTKLRMVEVAEWLELQNKPHSPQRPPILFSGMHDNNNGDAVFSMYNKMHSGGLQSFLTDKMVDDLIEKATVTPLGPERTALWQEANRRIYEDLVAHVWLYHMVGYSRVGSRIEFKPSISTNSEIQISQMRLK
jgi:peptide/nickel transport system substrate-binding protein